MLGSLEVADDAGRVLALGAGRQRALLALLLLRANRRVQADELVDGLWGDSPPPTAQQMLQNQVSALRRVLGRDGRLETHRSAYQLNVREGELDVDRFERLLECGRARLAGHEPAAALDAFREALSLWRGPALADFAYDQFAQAEIMRLEERRLAAFEDMVQAQLALGRHEHVVAELTSAVAEHPLRERLHGQLMLALYRDGRQAEALEAYRAARQRLVEDIGVEPGRELRELQAAILAQDPALDLPSVEDQMPAALSGGSPVIVGRERELAALAARLAEARAGRGGVLMVSGPHGIGKTRLAAEAARAALEAGMTVAYAGASLPPDEALAAVRRIAVRDGAALLVLDDADDAAPALLRAVADVARDARELSTLVMVLHVGSAPPPVLEAMGGERIALGPLGTHAVGEIARLYIQGRRTEVPAHALEIESGGVPLRVHRAAAEWARDEAAERVSANAARAAADRSDLRAAETDLAADLNDLQAVRELERLFALDPPPPALDGRAAAACPFLGLATFDAAHAEYFFGRERLVSELVARLVGSPLLALVGPSGSGKSSALRAGLLPTLADGGLPGSDRWRYALLRPGRSPLRQLDASLRRVAGGSAARGVGSMVAALGPDERVLLAVDQFEEIFTACGDAGERAEFVDAIVAAARDPERRCVVVLTLRTDFYGECAEYDDLAALVAANQVLVGPMRRDELRRAIELPARRAGLSVETSLVSALTADVVDEPGGLPLLSTALVELWQAREGRILRRSAYVRMGGVRGAVARLAENTYARLTREEQSAARRILMRLADEGPGSTYVRRRVTRDELDLDRDEHAASALARLTDGRLVTVDGDAVEVAHEALMSEWPRLRGWLEEDAEGRQVHRDLSRATRAWQERGRDPGELYRGARLAAALGWIAQRSAGPNGTGSTLAELNAAEQEFLDASRAAAERDQRRLRLVLACVATLLVAAVAAGIVALEQRGTARSEALTAEAQRLGAQALTENDLDRSLLLAMQGVALDDTTSTRGNLLAALLRSPAAIGVLRGDGDRLLSLALHPDGGTLAVADNDGTVLFLDPSTRRPTGRYDAGGVPLFELEYSPDATRVAIAGGDVIELLDGRTHRRIARLDAGNPGPWLENLRFSPDSRVLIADRSAPVANGQGPGELVRWDARTGRRLEDPRQISAEDLALVDYVDRGSRLLTSNAPTRSTIVRDASTLQPLRRFRVGGLPWGSAVSADGRLAALGGEDGTVRLLDLRSGRIRTGSGRHEAAVRDASFTPDGRRLVTAGDDGRVIVWDVARATALETFEGHTGQIRELELSADGGTAYTASMDGSVIVWDLTGARRLGRPFSAVPIDPEHPVIAVSPDGGTFALPDHDGDVALYGSQTLERSAVVRVRSGGRVTGIAFTPDGRTLAATDEHGGVSFWDVRTHEPLAEPVVAHVGRVSTPAFSADGRWMATVAEDRTVRLWDARRRRPVGKAPASALPQDVSLSPDGRTLAVTTGGAPEVGSVEVLTIPDLRRTATLRAADGLWGRFSPDGRIFVFGDFDGRLRLLDARSWKPLARPVIAHPGGILTASVSADSRTLATTSFEGAARLWELPSGRPIAEALPGPPHERGAAAFTSGGSHLVAVYTNGTAIRWDVRPAAWARHACAVAGRSLSRDEWETFLRARDYAPACAG